MADTMILAPYGLMRETARAMSTEAENFLAEYQGRWRTLQSATNALPASMQPIFNAFLGNNRPHLTDAITLHSQIGQTLFQSADLAEALDLAMSESYG